MTNNYILNVGTKGALCLMSVNRHILENTLIRFPAKSEMIDITLISAS